MGRTNNSVTVKMEAFRRKGTLFYRIEVQEWNKYTRKWETIWQRTRMNPFKSRVVCKKVLT